MNSDNYEYAKSSTPQSVDNYSAYTDKQWNYINDINNGVYSNNSGLTQVQFDLTSIYNSGGFTDTADMYLTVPIVMSAAYVTAAGAVVTLPTVGLGAAASLGGCAAYSLCSLKSNYQNLIHQVEIQADGKVINETQPFTNVVQGFRLLSQMSTTDLHTFGPSLNFNQALDNEKSMAFNMTPSAVASGTVTYTNRQGIGLVNNIPYIAGSSSAAYQSGGQTAVNGGTVNTAIANRLSKFADFGNTPAQSSQSIYGTYPAAASATPTQLTIMSATQISTEFKPYFTVVGNIVTWYDVGIIPLKYLTDVMDKMGLVRKLSAVMRIYFNTGSIAVPVNNPALSTQYFGAPTNSTFPNTCPFTINNVQGAGAVITAANPNPASVPLTTAFVCAGCFIARAPTTAIGVGGGSINIGNGVANHPMAAVRAYYSLVKLEPSRALKYVEENRNKLVVYEQFITNQYNAIGAASSFSQLVQSGIKNPLGIAIIPLIAQTQSTTSASTAPYGFSQYGSPLDTCPATFAPISLTNLQVTLGGQNVLNSTLFENFSNFLQQIYPVDNLTSSDLGIGAGLISQNWWDMNRVYYVDLKRSRDADKASTRNLNISFTNNSSVVIDLLVFTFYLDKLVVDVETGLIRK